MNEVKFILNDGEVNFKLNAETADSIEITFYRLLEDGFRRILQDGSFRLLENNG